MSDSTAHEILQVIQEQMRKALLKGRSVSLRGIGTLEPYTKKASKYRHPGTGALRKAKARGYLRFILSSNLRDEIA